MVVYDGPVPAKVPVRYHWYVGLGPRFVELAVKKIGSHEQMVIGEDGEILTLGVTDGLTVIVVVEDVTVSGLAQFAFDVIVQ